MRHAPRLLLLTTALLGCASTPRAATDSTRAAEHDPSLHDQHMAGGTARAADADSSFAALQARGAMGMGMGVDQYTSTHTFEPRADGGRITLRRAVNDPAGVEQIRAHLRTIADAFAAGDFTTPAFVHADAAVPGTDVMAAKRALISYRFAPIPDGAELVITTSDRAAIEAIHSFLAYQRRDHRAGDGSPAAPPPPLRR